MQRSTNPINIGGARLRTPIQRMGFTANVNDIYGTGLDVDLIAARKNSGYPKSWSAVSYAEASQGGGKISGDGQSPGVSDSKSLHAERQAIANLCKQAGTSADRSASGGQQTGTNLNQAGVTNLTVAVELPPCPDCKRWLDDVATGMGASFNVYHYGEFDDYFDGTKSKAEKQGMWKNFFETYEKELQ